MSAARIPTLELLRQTLLSPTSSTAGVRDARAEAARRLEWLELRYGAEVLLQLKGRGGEGRGEGRGAGCGAGRGAERAAVENS